MAKGYLGIELSSAKLRYVFFTKKGKKLYLQKAGAFVFKVDPSTDGALTHMITNIFKREDISPEKIFVSLSRADVLARELMLPPMKTDEYEAVIVSEIEKMPTFSENSFDYIYQKFEIAKDKSNIIFAAINQKILSYILNEVQDIKIPFLSLDITPLNIPKVVSTVSPFKANQAFLMINDMVSHLVIYKENKYKLFYKTTTGSNYFINEGIVNEKNISTFAGEVQRVIKAYLNENKEERIEDLLLLWDKKASLKIEEELQKNLELKIQSLEIKDYFEIADDASEEIKKAESLDNPAYLFAGAGIFAEHKKLKLQFPLDHFFRAFHIKRCFSQVSLLSIIFILISGFFIGRLYYGLYKKKKVVTQAIENVRGEKEDLKIATIDLYKKRDEYLTVRQGLLDQATFLKVINRVYWTDVLGVVAQKMPPNLSLLSFNFRENGKIVFKGESLNIESVSELIREIDKSELLTDGRFDTLTEKVVQDKKVFSFGILAKLKKMSLNDIEKEDNSKQKEKE